MKKKKIRNEIKRKKNLKKIEIDKKTKKENE